MSTAELINNTSSEFHGHARDIRCIQKRRAANHFCLAAIATLLTLGLTAPAQSDKNDHKQPATQAGTSKIEQHMKLFTERLALTSDQQIKIKPILQETIEATHKLMKDETISPEERSENLRPRLERADKQIRELLNDLQKEKLDGLERELHAEFHRSLNGTAPQPASASKARQHLKVLADKLALTGAQQAGIGPILQEMHDATRKLTQDKQMAPEERLDKVRSLRERADKQIRELLNSDQKEKLDRLERESHPELHGDLWKTSSGRTSVSA